MTLGPQWKSPGQVTFTVWAPLRERMELHVVSPCDAVYPMQKDDHGYWQVTVDDLDADARYLYRLDGGEERPDPASPYQPDGVHKPSAMVNHAAFAWTDAAWRPPALAEWIIYELHVGTFTAEGTFAAVIPRLP
ncbi:MAG: malto-oligosyltrehalose trehalohydrolase, partial [Candidatus Omnitrophica bacterium]|nr:malto-oligosyltrehalose trehalohydrolase [Candidatus Omnitrophota bacterium]